MGRKFVYIVLMIAVVGFLYYLEEKAPDLVESASSGLAAEVVSPFNEFGPEFLPAANGQLIVHSQHALSYREDHEQAEWVAYQLRPEHLSKDKYKRPYFKDDPAVKTGSARFANYKNTDYNKGHLLPAADRKQSLAAYSETFVMSNVSPQDPGFNSGIWNRLEQKVRHWAKKYDGVYVVTGGVLQEGLTTIGDEQVSVPEYFYKIIVDVSDGRQRVSAFMIPNKKTADSFYDYQLTVDEIELQTGIDFFAGLDPEMEASLESGQWKALVD